MTATIRSLLMVLALALAGCSGIAKAPDYSGFATGKHEIAKAHPRLLGSADYLKRLAQERPEAWARVDWAARNLETADETVMDEHMKAISMGLVYVVEGDSAVGRAAVERVLITVRAPIRVGHDTFGYDMAKVALVYDLCWPLWTQAEKEEFYDYCNRTIDANVNSELAVFHNAWYGYKWWGYGLTAYATWYEWERAPKILAELEKDYAERAAPALELSGQGGGFAEGYYINYWSYEWLFFCEAARAVEGKNYYALAPGFFHNRAVACMFEAYPWISENSSHRPIPMGDSGGQRFRRERDKALAVRRILINFYRDDPAHQAVHAFNEETPRCGVPGNAYKDFLWRDTTVTKGDLAHFKLSHISTGPGYVYARSSWDNGATYFFFKCGDRFTAHQHLDNGHFLFAKYDELAGDGGQYFYFGGDHDTNYLLRTIAHSTVTVYNPAETWTNLRAFAGPFGNDGGQRHDWPHHNGSCNDIADRNLHPDLYELADITAYEDKGAYMYVAGDMTKAYKADKMGLFTRQIVFLRPGTLVIFDRVTAKDKDFTKRWLLQASKAPTQQDGALMVTNDFGGRMFVRTLLPREAKVKLNSGDSLYCYDGHCYPAEQSRGPAPECRVEISPPVAAETDYFLNVLTAADTSMTAPPEAGYTEYEDRVEVNLEGAKVTFRKGELAGQIELGGQSAPLAAGIVQ